MVRRRGLGKLSGLAILAILGLTGEAQAQFGIVLSGVGPVNRSMGGASVAAPIDASGAIHWNPATMSAFDRSEMEFGLEALYPRPRLSSRINENALGLGVPPITLGDATESSYGAVPVPTLGLVYQPCDSPLTYGLGVFAVGGIGVNYSASTTNPILTPQAPVGLGLGALYTNLQVMQMAPSVSLRVNEQLAVGFAPTITMANLQLDPLVVAAPDFANGDLFATYPNGSHTRVTWGGGFQAGVYWEPDEFWSLGFSFKSPQWFEKFRFQSADELGLPRLAKFEFEYPMIISAGAAYRGIPSLTLAADIRWVDYAAAEGFKDVGFGGDGAIVGAGWKSIFCVALGAQWQASEILSLRIGYTWNENPIPDEFTFFNVFGPAIVQHTLHLGASIHITDNFIISGAYVHGFENKINGPMIHPLFGPLPNTWVQSSLYADALIIGATVKF